MISGLDRATQPTLCQTCLYDETYLMTAHDKTPTRRTSSVCEPVEILVVALFHMGGCLLHEMGLRLFARSFISPRQTNSMGVPFPPLTVSPTLSAGLLIPRFFRCKWPKNLHVALETMARWGAPAGRELFIGQPLE